MPGAALCRPRKVNISKESGKLKVPLNWWWHVCCFYFFTDVLQAQTQRESQTKKCTPGTESETFVELPPFFVCRMGQTTGTYQTELRMPSFSFVSFPLSSDLAPKQYPAAEETVIAAPASWILTLCTKTMGGICDNFLVSSLFPGCYIASLSESPLSCQADQL